MVRIEWMCTKCGRKEHRSDKMGRPSPGKCPKNYNKEHRWVINRKGY